MRSSPRPPSRSLVLALAAACSTFVAAVPAAANRDHVVRGGQSLARVARRYGVSVDELAAANGMDRGAVLREGQLLTVPSPGEVHVRAGDTLARIARRHEVDVEALARENSLRPGAPLRVGQRLLLPGHSHGPERDAAQARWGRPRRSGVATLVRIWSKEQKHVRLVDARGRVPTSTVRMLRHLLRPRDSKRRRDPDPRLVQLLARVSDHFGGRPIHIVSGYRLPGGTTKPTSRHVQGHAVDFRIPGVPIDEVHELCSRFERVGVGLYPTSRFVHLDVRDRNARWTDWSGSGESARSGTPDDDAGETEEPGELDQ